MNIEKLNPWFTFLANIGVLAGIVFLAIEIQQSNNIAQGNAGAELMQLSMSLNASFYENSEVAELAVKLAYVGSVLTAEEEQKARFLAYNKTNLWQSAEYAYINGLIGENEITNFSQDITDNFNMFPGLIPHWKFISDTFDPDTVGIMWSKVFEELETRGY